MFLALYDAAILRRPKIVVCALVALLACASYWVTDFQLDASSDSLILENDDDLRFSREIEQRYGGEEFVVVTYTPSDDLLSTPSLDRLERLRGELRKIGRVASVTTLLDVPLLRNPPVPLGDLRQNIKTLEHPDVDPELARTELETSPLYRNLLVSEDLQSTALLVTFAPDATHAELARRRSELLDSRSAGTLSPDDAAELGQLQGAYDGSKDRLRDERHDDISAIRAVLDGYRADAELFLGGVPMIVDDIVVFIGNDLVIFGFGMLLLLVVTLGIIFRKVRWVALPILCCASSAVVMMGLLGFLGWEVTVVSSNFVSLQLIFTMSLTIHLVVRYRELLRAQPDEGHYSLVRMTVRHTFVPCLYASLTTVAGFSSLVFCDILPVVTFGWMMTLGLMVSLAVTFIVFPACLVLLSKPAAEEERDFGIPLTAWFANLTEHRGSVILVVSALVAALTVVGATRLRVENSFIDYFRESTEIYRGMEFIDRELGGTTPLDVVLDFDSGPDVASAPLAIDDGFVAPEALDEFDEFDDFDEFETEEAGDREKYWFTTTKLERIAKVHDYLDDLEATGKVMSLATLWKLGRDINQGQPLDNLLLAILFQQMPDSLKDPMVHPYASIENDQARISVRIKDSLKSLRRDELLTQIRADLTDKLGLREDQFRVSGLMVLYNNMLQSLFESQIQTVGYTVGALMAMFVLLFRSLKIALIAIIPSLLSSLAVIGVMGLSGIPLDVMTITIVAISVGIAVDDTIHYIHRFQHELALDGDYVKTMHRCHRSIGNAMYYTSITITIGFSILAISNFIPSVYFGLLTALAMTMALVSALSLLPRLIILTRPFKVEVA